jgi:ABC-2 type transport system ATP-binding protein
MIEVSNLTRYYGQFAALSDVSFSVDKGQIIGLLGLNGAGKSTTLQVLAGLMSPSSGTLTIEGQDGLRMGPELLSVVGFLPEEPPLYMDMTTTDFLCHVGRLKGMSLPSIKARLPEILELTQLTHFKDHTIRTLSHGYKKRVGIAQAVLHDPKVLILDEPISGLDPVQIVEMRSVIRNLGKGRAVIISSHILSEISQTCDRILVLHEGRLVAQGTEAQLASSLTGDRITLTLRTTADRIGSWLTEHEAVESHSLIEEAPPLCKVSVHLKTDAREGLIADIVAAAIPIRLVEGPGDELETIFLGLTKGGAQA